MSRPKHPDLNLLSLNLRYYSVLSMAFAKGIKAIYFKGLRTTESGRSEAKKHNLHILKLLWTYQHFMGRSWN